MLNDLPTLSHHQQQQTATTTEPATEWAFCSNSEPAPIPSKSLQRGDAHATRHLFF
mgnify:CR=1 FL=1